MSLPNKIRGNRSLNAKPCLEGEILSIIHPVDKSQPPANIDERSVNFHAVRWYEYISCRAKYIYVINIWHKFVKIVESKGVYIYTSDICISFPCVRFFSCQHPIFFWKQKFQKKKRPRVDDW